MTDLPNIVSAFERIPEPWKPHRLATVNDQDVKVARLQGEFVWHAHPDSDELFLVVDGRLTIQLRDRDVELAPNDVFVVPPWQSLQLRAGSDTILFSFSDRPVQQTLGLWREQKI